MTRRKGDGLEAAECLTLNPAVRANFYDIDTSKDPIRAKAAKNICSRCVVAPECLQDALNGPKFERGIMAGLSASEIKTGRQWLAFELGIRATLPLRERPLWLPRSEASEMVESLRVAADADEVGDVA